MRSRRLEKRGERRGKENRGEEKSKQKKKEGKGKGYFENRLECAKLDRRSENQIRMF